MKRLDSVFRAFSRRRRSLRTAGRLLVILGVAASFWLGCEADSEISREAASSGACLLDKDVLNFGAAVIATGASRDTLHVRNVGDGPLDGRIALTDPNFRVESGAGRFQLAPGRQHEIVVAFEPVEPGSLEFVLDVGTGCRSVFGSGVGLRAAGCAITGLDTGGFVDFGTWAIGAEEPASRIVEVTNTGDVALEIDAQLVGESAGFTLDGGGPHVLEGGASRSFTLLFQPAELRSYNCELALGPASCGSVLLLGRGVLGALCEISGLPINFGTIALGDRVSRSLTIHNGGDDALTGTTVLTGSCDGLSIGAGGGAFSIPPDQNRIVRIDFQPATSGARACELDLGTACGAAPIVAIGDDGALCQRSRTSIDFGDLDTNVERLETVTITNTGGSRLDLDITLSDPGGPFSIRRGGGSQPLARDESVEVEIAFESALEGSFGAELVLGSSECPSIPLAGQATDPALCVVPDPELDLGRIVVGETVRGSFTLRNDGGRPLTGEVQLGAGCAEFALLDAPAYEIGPRSAQDFEVEFAPQTIGSFECTITTGSACAPVTVRAQSEPPPACELSAALLDFGSVTIGSELPRSLTVRNSGGGRLTGVVSLTGDAFTIEDPGPFDLGAGQSLQLVVRFRPTSEGPASATISFGTGLCDDVPCTGTGRLPADCIVSTTLLDFGTLVAGEQAERSFVITNSGGTDLTGTVALSGCTAEFTIVEGGGPYTLGSGEQLTVRVVYAPSGAGNDECIVDAGQDCDSVVLLGAGLDPPECSIDPPSIDFGTVIVGQTSAWAPFVIRNTGGAPLSVNLALGAGCGEVELQGGGVHNIAAGDSAEARVRWSPTSPAAFECVLETGSTLCGQLVMTGTAEPPALCILDATGLTFGPIVEGDTEQKTLHIENGGGDRLDGNVVLAGCGAEFAIIEGAGGFSLGAGEVHTVTIEFRPTLAGDYSCALDLGTECDDVSLSGTAEEPPSCEVAPTLLDYGTLHPGESRVDSFLVRNAGGGELDIVATLGVCEDFALASDGTFTLGALEERWILVEFSPNDAEESQCVVSLTGGCDPVTVVGVAEAIPQCGVSTTNLQFGTVTATGSNFRDLTFTLENVGGGTLTGTILESCTAFHLLNSSGNQVSSLPFSLGAGETMEVGTRFRPTTLGDQSCSFVIQTDSGTDCVVNAFGHGAASYALHIASRLVGCSQGAGHQHQTSFQDYQAVMTRVNLGDPPCSILLRKPANLGPCPSGGAHGGGLISGWEWGTGTNHIVVRDWIVDGAAP